MRGRIRRGLSRRYRRGVGVHDDASWWIVSDEVSECTQV